MLNHHQKPPFGILPRKLTWNLKMDPWKRRFLLETIPFRFHASFRGCNIFGTFSKHPTYANPRPPRKNVEISLGGCGLRRNFMPWSCVKMPMSFNGLLNKRCAMSGFNEKNRLGGFKYLLFSPIFGDFFPFWLYNMFQRGWFNHQLEKQRDQKITYPPLNQQIAMESSHLFLVNTIKMVDVP